MKPNKPSKYLLFVPIVLMATLGATTSTQPALLLTDRLLGILEMQQGEGDLLPALAQAVANPGKSLDPLAAAILSAKPGAFNEAVLAHVTLASADSKIQIGAHKWKYGTFMERTGLRKQLWDTAKAVAKTDPEKAKRYARAAFLFESMDSFVSGEYSLNKYFRDEAGMQAAAVSEDQRKALLELVKEPPKVSPLEQTALRAVDRLFKHPDEFDAAAKKLADWSRIALTNDADSYSFCGTSRQFLNHAVAAKNEEAERHERETLASVMAQARNEHVKRWLKEALDLRGEPQRVYLLTVWKDGKFVDTDSDGNVPEAKGP